MVFGLIEFLMGGKKKQATSKVGAVSTPNVAANMPQQQVATGVPDGVNQTTANAQQGVQFVDSNAQQGQVQGQTAQSANPTTGASGGPAQNQPAQQGAAAGGTGGGSAQASSQQGHGGKKSISEVIHKLHDELAELKERSNNLVTDIKNTENSVNEIGHRVDALEEFKKENSEKMAEMEENMTKFLSLYELINNQYNPFIDKESVGQPQKAMAIAQSLAGDSNSGAGHHESSSGNSPFSKPDVKSVDLSKVKAGDLDSALLELDTLDIEEAAADAVPLTKLKNNTNSLVVILSWLEYLIKKVGIEETRASLRYYTEVLRWVTPDVFFDLDKYLRGMKDVKVEEGSTLGVKDHIVSLYFISKLNEKKLDEKLTNAVLQIIKE